MVRPSYLSGARCRIADRAAAALLDDMGQLMRQQASAGRGPRHIFTSGKSNPSPDRVGACADRRRRPCCRGVSAYPHVAQVTAEARLEKRTRDRVKRLAGGTQHVVNQRRYLSARGMWRRFLPMERVFLPVGGAFAAELKRSRVRHAHHLVGDAIGVALERVVAVPDHQFRLNRIPLGEAIRLMLINIALFVLAALFAFAGEISSSRT